VRLSPSRCDGYVVDDYWAIIPKGAVIGGLNARRGTIIDSEIREDEFTAVAEVALNDMFGYSSQLRGLTQGKGEFNMEYKACFPSPPSPGCKCVDSVQNHMPVLPNVQAELQEAYRKSLPHNNKK
jgi:elongation factor G